MAFHIAYRAPDSLFHWSPMVYMLFVQPLMLSEEEILVVNNGKL